MTERLISNLYAMRLWSFALECLVCICVCVVVVYSSNVVSFWNQMAISISIEQLEIRKNESLNCLPCAMSMSMLILHNFGCCFMLLNAKIAFSDFHIAKKWKKNDNFDHIARYYRRYSQTIEFNLLIKKYSINSGVIGFLLFFLVRTKKKWTRLTLYTNRQQ